MNLEKIKELRKLSGLGLGVCKKVLEEVHDDIEEALVLLKKRGMLREETPSVEEVAGRLHTFLHHDGSKICLLEVNCQTEEGAKRKEFIDFCDMVAMHACFTQPKYLNSNDIPEEKLARQREIYEAQIPEKAPPDKVPHIVNNKLKRWFSEVCLIDQKSVVPDADGKTGATIEQLRTTLVTKINENIEIKRFVCWELGGK